MLGIECTFYDDSVAHHQNPDRIIVAQLHGAASRLAGWSPPSGEARAQAVAELVEIATVTPRPARGSLHQPPGRLRGDLLAEAAGVLLGTAPTAHPEAHRAAAELLVEAGADRGLLDHWIGVGRARAAGAEGALLDRESPHRWP